MNEKNTDLIQGTLDMLILKTLRLQPLHGYGIARHIEQRSGEVFRANAGSILTALKRLERAGLLRSEWKESETSRRAKYYELTPAGHERLRADVADWNRRAIAVFRLLESES